MIARTVLTMAALTVKEASRRKVVRALAALTLVLLALSAWGFHRLSVETGAGELTSGEARLFTSQLLNLVLFGFSLIAALGTAFLAGPTVSGELESGTALSMLARPVRRGAVLAGKWLGLVVFGCGYVALAGLAQLLVVELTADYWPPDPAGGLALLAAQTVVLLSLGLLLSTLVSPMASGVVAVGAFGATWIAGVVGGVGQALENDSVARVGEVSRMLIPTDGLWRGAMYAFQDGSVFSRLGPEVDGFPFLGTSGVSAAYLGWAALWVAIVVGLATMAYGRRDL